MIDVAIIGSGPAGLSAAINVRARNKNAVIFGRSIKDNLLYLSKDVDNYLGLPKISGAQMLEKFKEHALSKGAEFKEGRVFQIYYMDGIFSIDFENEFYEAKSVILATGRGFKNFIPGEEKLLGKGVSYCATCDGMLYRGKNVVLYGETAECEEDVKFLSGICQKVWFLPAYNTQAEFGENVEIIREKPIEVLGADAVSGLKTENSAINCDAVFFLRKNTPLSSLIFGLETENGHINVKSDMSTNIAGVFAAGDVLGEPYQVATAVGSGLIAALSAVRFIG